MIARTAPNSLEHKLKMLRNRQRRMYKSLKVLVNGTYPGSLKVPTPDELQHYVEWALLTNKEIHNLLVEIGETCNDS